MFNIINSRLTGWQVLCSSTMVLSLLLASGAAMADRPEWAGSRNGDDGQKQKNKYKKDKKSDSDREDNDRSKYRQESHRQTDRDKIRRGGIEIKIGGYIDDSHRTETRDYYRERSRSGRCPPGLAKKRNGCVPPGQAKRWTMGEYLPRDVIYHSVEPDIQIRLGTPPAGHRFVRVAADILLIAVGTGMVIDAIEDLGQ
jgi:Ni/Co efflux regulator RcnB